MTGLGRNRPVATGAKRPDAVSLQYLSIRWAMGFLLGNGYFAGPPSENGALMIGGRTSLKGAVSPNTGLALTQFARIRLGPGGFLVPGWTWPKMHFL